MTPLFKRDKGPASPLAQPLPAAVAAVQAAEFAAFYYGQRQGGDFYDFLRVENGRILFCLMDVAGILAENRRVVCAIQDSFRKESPLLFAGQDINESEAIIELNIRLNRRIIETEDGLRATPAFVACYNEASGIVCYGNAGHTAGLLKDGAGITELSATGLPLGLFSHAPGDAQVSVLGPGASLLLVSRGIVEGKHKGQEFGMERVKAVLEHTPTDSAKELCKNVINELRQFMNTPPTHDDVTALALVRSAPA